MLMKIIDFETQTTVDSMTQGERNEENGKGPRRRMEEQSRSLEL